MNSRRLIPEIMGLDLRALPDATPVSLVGHTLVIQGARDGHTAAVVTYGSDPSVLEVDYGTGTHVDAAGNFQFGPLETYTFETSDVESILFVGHGDLNLVENDTIVIPETVIVVGDHNSFVNGPEYDFVVMVGHDNYAADDGNFGDIPDHIVLIDRA